MTLTENTTHLRWLYVSNIIAAGIPGLMMIAAPVWARANMFPGPQDPAIFGMTGSIWLAIGIASVVGLRVPNLFKGLLLIQMIYKTIWVSTVGLPLLVTGNLSVLPLTIFFIMVVIGFGITLFPSILAKPAAAAVQS